jgi:hypothetical protein
MYETLFGYNAMTDTVIPVIGTSNFWNIASDTEYIINLNPATKLSTGAAITAMCEADFNFDLSGPGKIKSEMRCPKCKRDNIMPLYGK